MKLSQHFTLNEFIKSNTATRLGIDNTPEDWQIHNMKMLCEHVLEPVRSEFGMIIVNSGFRTPELCNAIGSSPRSNHAIGCAADIESPKYSNIEIFDFIANNLEFKELIAEYFDENDPHAGWVHVAYQENYNYGKIKLKDKTHNYAGVTKDYVSVMYRRL